MLQREMNVKKPGKGSIVIFFYQSHYKDELFIDIL